MSTAGGSQYASDSDVDKEKKENRDVNSDHSNPCHRWKPTTDHQEEPPTFSYPQSCIHEGDKSAGTVDTVWCRTPTLEEFQELYLEQVRNTTRQQHLNKHLQSRWLPQQQPSISTLEELQKELEKDEREVEKRFQDLEMKYIQVLEAVGILRQ